MKYAAAVAALSAAAMAMPQGVTQSISPDATAPAGCMPTYSGDFSITIVNVTESHTKREVMKRQSGGAADTALVLSLANGELYDVSQDKWGYIASNYQLQFDNPPQAGAIYTAGFSACPNGSLALGGSTIFWACQSGEGANKFYNFYDRDFAPELCSPIYIDMIKAAAASGSASSAASVRSDGQPAATSAVSIRSDGQPIATSAVSIRSDGQPIAATASAVSIRSDGQPIAATASAVSIRSDGQPIAATASAVSIRSDGQPIAATATPVSIRSDGQPIVATATPVMTPTPTPSVYTGGASVITFGSGLALLGAGAFAVAML